jgi:hypothetical protein
MSRFYAIHRLLMSIKEMMYNIKIENEIIRNREANEKINKQLYQLIVYKDKPTSIINL